MEKYKITLAGGASIVGEFDSDRAAIAHAVNLNHGCSDSASVSRIADNGRLIPTRLTCGAHRGANNRTTNNRTRPPESTQRA